MIFHPDATVQLMASRISDVSEGVRALSVICTSIYADEDTLPEHDVRLAYHQVWTMTQFIENMKALESMMLILQGWYEDTWAATSQELLTVSVYPHTEGGFEFRMQSTEQYNLDVDAYGERKDLGSLEVTTVGIARIMFGAFHEYCRDQYGAEFMDNDPTVGRGGIRVDSDY